MSVSGKQKARFLLAILVLGVTLTSLLPMHTAEAAQITSRSLTLQDGATDGGSKPGGVVNHFFQFTIPTTGTIGSIQFKYCAEAAGSCTLPTSMDSTVATSVDDTGSAATGFTLAASQPNGTPYITRTAASVSSGSVLKFKLLGVKNPTTANYSFYVRITTFASTDTTGSATDTGTVAGSTATQIVLTGTMPESLIFCTGQTISTTGGIPDCSTATTGNIGFNQLFSPADTATATSQMAASTNGLTGYAITVAGPTLTSGSNTITAMGSATTSLKGTRQFGMNLLANTSAAAPSFPGTSANVAPSPNGTTLKGQPSTGYDTADTFKFTSGDTIARSDNGGAGPTDAQIYTASYIVNVSGGTAEGTYTTTLTYVCTATF